MNIEEIRELLDLPVFKQSELNYEFTVTGSTLITLLQVIELTQFYKVSLIGTNKKATLILHREAKSMINKLNSKVPGCINIDNLILNGNGQHFDILIKDYKFLPL